MYKVCKYMELLWYYEVIIVKIKDKEVIVKIISFSIYLDIGTIVTF